MKIALDNVSFRYGKRRRTKHFVSVPILEHISLTINQGEMLALAGRSGCGKSTLLQLMKGFITPVDGRIILEDVDPYADRCPEYFDRIGLIFQYPEHQLFASTVYEDIAFGLRHQHIDDQEKQVRVRQAMAAVQLDYETLRNRSPFELSGGEKRRVAIAGIVVLEPEVLILDEPSAGLDLQSRNALFQLLHQLNQEKKLTIIWVSHQLEEIAQHARRLIAIHHGAIQADGSPETLFADPHLCQLLGWEEPAGLTIGRILQGTGQTNPGWLSPQQAADVIVRLHRRHLATVLQES